MCEPETTRQFHAEWTYDLFCSMDEVMDNFNIQYEECAIDVENPPVFTFFSENSHIRESFWWFAIIIDEAFGYNEYEFEYKEIGE